MTDIVDLAIDQPHIGSRLMIDTAIVNGARGRLLCRRMLSVRLDHQQVAPLPTESTLGKRLSTRSPAHYQVVCPTADPGASFRSLCLESERRLDPPIVQRCTRHFRPCPSTLERPVAPGRIEMRRWPKRPAVDPGRCR